MAVRAFLTAAFLFAALAPAGAVETAAHGAHLARCIGVLEEMLDGITEPTRGTNLRTLLARAREAAAAIDLADAEVERTVERGRAAVRRAAADGEGRALGDLLMGCRVVVQTGTR